jgi:hypothetical protein
MLDDGRGMLGIPNSSPAKKLPSGGINSLEGSTGMMQFIIFLVLV